MVYNINDVLITTRNIPDLQNSGIWMFTKNVPYIIKGLTLTGYLITSNIGVQEITIECLDDFFNIRPPQNDTFDRFDHAMGVV